MSRRSREAAERAAQDASEAARLLQQRGQEAKAEKAEEPPAEKAEIRTVIPRNEPRRLAMEEIEARDLRTKGLDLPGIQPEPQPEKVEDPAPPKPEDMLQGGKFTPAPPTEPEEKPAEPAAPPQPELVKVKVDGEEFDVPKAEVDEAGGVKLYQLQRAAENRLKKANEALAEAKRTLAESAKPREPEKPKETDEQFIASRVDAIRFGTPEESAAALKEILARTNKPIDQSVIVEQAINKFNHDQAVREFDKEFAEIVTNPLLLKLTVTLRNERIGQLQGPVDWSNFYRTIGNEVRSVLGKPSQPASAPVTGGTPSPGSDKEARKASIVNLPTAAARAELPKGDKPETREDILNEMRRARGQPVG